MDSSVFFFISVIAAAVGLLMFTLFRILRFYREENKENDNSASSSSSSSLSRYWTHHVFPSFHGIDVRRNLLSHLLAEFSRKGITPFIDGQIRKGESFGSVLIQAIRGSKIAIIILSKNYASSSWCLEELAEIMECREELGQTVMVVFYEVDASDVRRLNGKFGKAFRKTCAGRSKEDIRRWTQALEKVATIAGYHSANWDNEAAMINQIATDISNKLNNYAQSCDFYGGVGIRAHLEKMEEVLCLDSNEVRMVGIWGPSGIGKTTIARAVYNKLSNRFQLSVFMESVESKYTIPFSDDYRAKLHLQQKFMSQITNHKDMKISHLGVVQDMLNDKKVLVVLDGVNQLIQLDAMAKELGWFGPGSRIIVTTQDKRLLSAHGINDIYKVGFPSTDEALQSSLHPYKVMDSSPPQSALSLSSPSSSLSRNWTHHVFPSFRGEDVRRDFLSHIQAEFQRKGITLFIDNKIKRGESIGPELIRAIRGSKIAIIILSKNYASSSWCLDELAEIMECREELGQTVMVVFYEVDASDVKKLTGDFGKVFKKTCVGKTEENIRRWTQALENVATMAGYHFINWDNEAAMITNIATDIIHKLSLSTPSSDVDELVGMQAYMEKKKQLLNLDSNEGRTVGILVPHRIRNSISPKFMLRKFRKLRAPSPYREENKENNIYAILRLRLGYFPMPYLPSSLKTEFLVTLHMPYSKLEKLWDGTTPLQNLKRINLRDSKELTELPDLSTATNLQELNLINCSGLIKLTSTIGHATNLQKLNISGCSSLINLPSSIGNVISLRELELRRCSSLTNLPSSIGNLFNLEKLDLRGCSSLVDRASSIRNACSLEEFTDCTSLVEFPSSTGNLHKLRGSILKGCSKLKVLPTNINLESLSGLDVQDLVFINFWGEEVCCSFISHLVYAFSGKGVNINIKKYEKRGEDLGNTLQIIEDSKIALVIFSSRYTESRCCLEELVKISEREHEGRLSIIPIFYKVEPSQVKQLEGDYGLKLWNLWRIHRDPRIIKWKHALESVASMKGLCLKDHSSESKFITSIVEKVLRSIHFPEGENLSVVREKTTKFDRGKGEEHPEGFLDKCPLFGLEHRLNQLEQKIEFDCNETRIIGVVGIPGIGKTTLARMLHEKWNCKFVRCAAFLGMEKKSEKWLRRTFLQMILGGKYPVINDETTHKSMKNKLLKTKVFIVLDDVSSKKQLKFLLDDLNWIKNGSKIVVTVRDKSLIEGVVYDTYVVPPLNYGEALQLFSYHAFGDHAFHRTVASSKLCTEFVDCAGGNPLIIKLLGKQLLGRDEAQWEMSQRDMADLGMMTLDIFKLSFDELSEKVKDVFLDIACFFRSENDYFVRSLLDPGGHNATDAESELRDLTHKCMITISDFRVEMHGLLYMFGKIYSSQALIEENGGKSRLWYTQEIIDALVNQKDTKSMRGIFLDMNEVTERMVLHRLTFIRMINLRYLKIYDSFCPRSCKAVCKLHFPDGLEFPLAKVRYLHWEKFPLEELPSDFRPENLVDMRLPYSMIERVWQGVKDTPQLKLVDLSHSSKLLTFAELAKAESLQRLNLEGCTKLDELPGEMKYMNSLIYLNLRGCIRLSSLPKMNLISLKTLILSNCSNLKKFQVISKSLEFLYLDGTAIKGLHPSIEDLQRLVLFNMKNCKLLESLPNCLGQLKALEKLILSGCSRLKNLPDVRQSMKHVQILLLDGIGATEMPKISCFTGSDDQASVDMVLQPSGSYPSNWPRGFDGISSLRRLCLSGNDFASLQTDIGKLYNLTWLDVKRCKKLRSVPMLPPKLQYFDAHGCDLLEKVGNPLAFLVLTEQVHAIFNFSNCKKLDQDAKDSIVSYTRRRSQLMLGALSRYNGGFTLEPLVGTCFPGWEIPEWFSHRGSGSVLEPKLTPHWCEKRLTGIALCAVIVCVDYHEQRNRLLIKCNCKFENEDGSSIHFSCTIGGWDELSNTPQKMELSHVFIGYTSRFDISNQVGYDEERCFCTKSSFEFQVTDGTENVVGCEVVQCGFSLVYATDDRENVCLDAKNGVIPKGVEHLPGVSSEDDIQSQSYSGPTLQRGDDLLNKRADARKFLQKSFENKRLDVFKNPGGEITIISNHHSTPTVGLELRLKELEKVLYSTPGKTRIVGVIGLPGSGKTTLANILFNKRGWKFPRHFILTLYSKKYYSEELKRKCLGELIKHTQGISKERKDESSKDNPLQTKCFAVLDNVSDKKQLEFLLGKLNWIKKGSKIIVTASDKSLVEGLAHEIYLVPHLNNREAFQVFSYHAFGGKICIPTGTFLSLSNMFVDNAGGNPLALKLLGRELFGKDEAYWKYKLQTVIQTSSTNIQDVWRFYIDQLTKRHRDVLLDIACFFRSEDEYFVRSLLDSGDPESMNAFSEVRGLAEKFLITISDGRVEMNDRHCTFCKDSGSLGGLRLWNYEDILDKLMKTKNLEDNIRGIFFDMSEVTRSIALERTTFINMRDLRYLKIYESCCPRKGKSDCKVEFPDGLDFSLEEVRYFHWLKFPLEELPPDFRPENLVDLRLPYSNIRFLWKGVKDIPRLKWVDLSYSGQLLNLSGLGKAESLQRLNLEGCTNLKKLPDEMQNMKSLVYLNMRGCIRLRFLPKMNLISLKTLILSDCSNLEEFQVISKSLEILHLDGTAIKGLPLAIQKVQRLVVLNLRNCKMLECLPIFLGKLKFLEEIILSGCSRLKNLPYVRHSLKHVQILLFDGAGVNEMPNLSSFIGFDGKASVDISAPNFESYNNPREWPRGVNRVSSLRRLCLSGNEFVSLENNIGQLYNLIWLDVKHCKKLRSVSMLPPRLQYFDAHGCDSLERVANPLALQVLTEQIHATYNFSNCNKLQQGALDSIISYTRWKSQLILNALSRYDEGFAFQALIGTCFPGWEVPTWFSYRASGSLLERKLLPHWCDNRFIGIAVCAVIHFPAYQSQRNNLLVTCNSKFKNKDESCSLFSFSVGGWSRSGEAVESSHVFISYASGLDIRKLCEENEEGCIHTEASFEFQVKNGTKEFKGCNVLKCGFSLVYEYDDLQVNSGEDVTIIDTNQDITSSSWIQDFFGYIFLVFSSMIILAILSFGVILFAPKYYMSFSYFCWPLLARILFYVAFGLFVKQ